jgi:MscS family membrane protein
MKEFFGLQVDMKKLILVACILLASLVVRYIFSFVILPMLRKLTNKTKTNVDNDILNIFEPPVNAMILFLGIFAISEILITNVKIETFLIKILKSFIIFEFCWILYRSEIIFDKALKTIFLKKKLDTALNFLPVFNKFIKVTVFILGFLLIIQEWGINIGALITGLGIGGVAVALAAKDTVANFFGSLMILLDTPFKIGDWIQTSNIEGVVEDIGFRSTKIRTFAQALISVPNSQLANDSITNWSKMGKRRITYQLGLKYDSPADKLKECIDKIRLMLENHPDIHKDTIFVYFNEFAESSLNIFLYFFTITTNWKKYLEVREDVNFKIKKIVENSGLEFAFPSTSLYIENQPLKLKKEG